MILFIISLLVAMRPKLCDDTVECLCSVLRNQENDNEAYRIISLQEPETVQSTLLSIFIVSIIQVCTHLQILVFICS